MRKRFSWRAAFIVFVLAALAFVVPGSPVYLPTLYSSAREHQGHSLRYWISELDSPERARRQQAVFAVGAIGSDAGEAVAPLARMFIHNNCGLNCCNTEPKSSDRAYSWTKSINLRLRSVSRMTPSKSFNWNKQM